MGYFHDESDSLQQLKKDVRDSDNPQHGNPDSVRQSAERELAKRGYTPQQITEMRLS